MANPNNPGLIANNRTEYNSFNSMRSRCHNPKFTNYEYYGGAGITVCERWLNSFSNFLEDMGKKPSKSYSLDRIDNNLGYFPENCRWATRSEQNRNRTVTKRGPHQQVEFRGVKLLVSEWARIFDVKDSRVRTRLQYGWTMEEALELVPRSGLGSGRVYGSKNRTY